MESADFNRSILRTLAYFDLFDFPLAQEELFRFLWKGQNIGYEEFTNFLLSSRSFGHELKDEWAERSEAEGSLHSPRVSVGMTVEKDGYVSLTGREAIVEARQGMAAVSEQKLKIARRAARLIRSAPFARAIFVCNSVAMGTAKAESDIDFFIIAAPQRIWIVRLFTNAVLKLFRLRVGKQTADKVCLCFFVDTEHLDLASLKIAEDDVYLTYWIHQLVPLYDPDDYHEKFLHANEWTKKFVPNMTNAPEAKNQSSSSIGKIWKKMWEMRWSGAYGNVIEKQAKQLQLTKMKPSLKEKSRLNNNEVIITDGVIKLHENDARRWMREQWLHKIEKIRKLGN